MKHFCFIFCILLIYAGLSDSSRQNTVSDARDFGKDLKGNEGGERTKRGIGSKVFGLGAAMIKGLQARQKLLWGLKPVKKFKGITHYNKNGGVTEMIADFDAVNPTNVKPFKLNGMVVGRQGKVGDRVISYDTGAATRPRSLTLSKTKRNGDIIVDIMTYRKIEM